jgi:ABC-type polysaccharide/polyol phosphate transport system ATPase subunit
VTGSAIEVRSVSKRFILNHDHQDSWKEVLLHGLRRRRESREVFTALDDVSLEVEPGTVFGLIGPNGAGKSTLLKCLAHIYLPDSGSIRVNGRMSSLLELGTGFHPDLSGRENVYLNGSILGLPRKEIARRFDEIVGFAELERFIDNPIKTYSSGMVVRLGFSVATCIEPEVLLVDEVLAVGDTRFKRKSRQRMEELLTSGSTIVLVAHDLPTIKSLCRDAASLVDGRVRRVGDAADVVDDYLRLVADQPDDVDLADHRGALVSAHLLDEDLRPISVVELGERVVVRVVVDAARCPPAPTITLSLRSVDGALLSFFSSNDTDIDVSYEGQIAVDAVVDGLRLAPGPYDFTVGLRDGETKELVDRIDRAVEFTVEGPSRSGYVVPLTAWSAEPVVSGNPLRPASVRSST